MTTDRNKSFNLTTYQIILASASPRRHHLLSELGLTFTIERIDVDEVYPESLEKDLIAEYLSNLKSRHFPRQLKSDEMLITADTVVLLGDEVLGKPVDENDAINMLSRLSGNKHTVISGVTISSLEKKRSFSVATDVYFKELTEEEIQHYVTVYKPLDKAGAYGIQEWIGYVGIERINGSFFNVMGLPLKELVEAIKEFS